MAKEMKQIMRSNYQKRKAQRKIHHWYVL